MALNPCCMQLNAGVKIVAHFSLALAIAVGVMGIRLISISLEVTTNPSFQQQQLQHLSSTPQLRVNEKGMIWKSDPMMKGSLILQGLIYAQDESHLSDDELEEFSYTHRLQKVSRDFVLEYSKVTLVCGLLAVCAAVFQFLCSSLLLFFINSEGKESVKIWIAVTCSHIFCLATCMVLFLCEGNSVPVFSSDEKLFLLLVTADILLSTYFLWIVIAFI